MKAKKMFSLGKKLTLLIILMAVTLSSATILFGFLTYKQTMERQYIELGQNLAQTVALLVDGDKIDGYLATGETDVTYDETLALMRTFKAANKIEYLYVVKPIQEGTYYIYDTDVSEDRCELGSFEEWYADFESSAQLFLTGQPIAPIISNESFGWLLSVYAPIHGQDGQVKGYVGADFSMNEVVHNEMQFLYTFMLISLVITVLFAVIYLYIIRKTIVSPINRMARAADNFLVEREQNDNGYGEEASSITELYVNTKDELESLAKSMKSMEQKIKEYIWSLDVATQKAETDVLTGLINRGAFQQRVSSFLHTCSEDDDNLHAFIMIDLDYFKSINDTYGHLIGDEVLRVCAKSLRKVFRSADDVARMGGDEFAVFCKSAGDLRVIEKKARQVCETWRSLSFDSIQGHPVTASIGVAVVRGGNATYQELYQQSDTALYQAKEQGRDRYVLHKE